MDLRTALEFVALATEERILDLLTRRQAGELSDDQLTWAATAVLAVGNSWAAGLATRAVAATLSRALGRPVPARGGRLTRDQERLRGAAKNIVVMSGGVLAVNSLLVRTEVFASGRGAMQGAMARHGAGWVRATNPDACELCRRWADGKVRSPAVRMITHSGCKCLPRPMPFPEGGTSAKAESAVRPGAAVKAQGRPFAMAPRTQERRVAEARHRAHHRRQQR